MAKAEISWKRLAEDGSRLQVKAHHRGNQWLFSIRQRRYDPWEPCPTPLLEDWQALLDGVERRVPRRLYTPQDVKQLKRLIQKNFPDVHFS